MNLKKLFAGVTTVTCSVMMIGGSAIPAFALTVEELEAQIAQLQAQLQLYMGQLDDLDGDDVVTPASSYDGIPDGFTFGNALYYGMNNTEVQYLQIILKSEIGAPTYPSTVGATGYFGNITKASVIAFQEMYANDILAVYGLTAGTGYVGTTTRAKLNELLAAAPTPPVGDDDDDVVVDDDDDVVVDGDYSVKLASSNPAATTLMDLSAYNRMLVFDAKAVDGDWDITSITVERFGISTDANVGGVLIQDEDGVRHGNVYTFSDKTAEIVFEGNPISIDEGRTETITVLYHIATGATSGTIGAKVTAINGDPSGLPVVGNTFTLADGDNVLGVVTLDVVTVSSTTVNVDVGTENQLLTKFKFNETGSKEDVYVEEITVYNNGSSADGDILNWELRDPNGVTLAEVAQTDDKYVTFDLTNSPGYKIPNGSSKTLSLYVDVEDGSTRTTQAVVMDDYDVKILGKDTNTRILVTAGTLTDTSFPMGDLTTGNAGFNQITATAGSLTLGLNSTSPTGTVAAGGSDVVFGKWDIRATGEDAEVRRIDMWLSALTAPDNGDSGTTADEPDDVFTGTIKLVTSDGVTRRSWSVGDSLPATSETTYTLSSYFTVPAGETETVSIIGNLRTDIASTDSFQFTLKDVYYKRMSTGDYTTTSTSQAANTLTGSTGSLTLVKDSAWGNKSFIAGSNKQIGQYVLQTGSSEGVYVSTINVDIDSVTGLNDIWIQKGIGTCSTGSSDLLGSVDSSPATTDNAFSVGGKIEIPASGSQTFIVCGNFNSSTATGTYTTDLDTTDVSATGLVSGESINAAAAATGQVMTVQTAGALLVKNGSNPNAQVLRANETGVKLLETSFSALYEDIKIDTFRFTVEDDGSQDRNFTNYTLKKGTSSVQSGKSVVNGVVTFSGLSEVIGSTAATYGLWADVNDVLTIGQDDNARVKFASVEAVGVSSNSNILESDENNYLGAITTEPGSTSSVGHYQQGDLVVSINNEALYPVTANNNEGVDLVATGLSIGGAAETFTTSEEISKFGGVVRAPTVGTSTTGIAVRDFLIIYDASGPTVTNGIVTAVVTDTSVALSTDTAVTLAATDMTIELSGTGYALGSTGPAVGDFVAYHDASDTSTTVGVVTAVTLSTAGGSTTLDATDSVTVNDTAFTADTGDTFFQFSSDVTQEAYSTGSTYQYGVGDVVYHYDNGGTSGWAVVLTGIRAGETMANLVTSDSTVAASDRIVRFSPGVIASNVMNIHDGEPIITASSASYSTGITGAMQTIAVYDIQAVGSDISIESLAITLEGSGEGQLATTADAWEVWEGGEKIQYGTDLEATAATTYTLDFPTPEEIAAGQTKTFTIKLNTAGTWTSTEVGMSLSVKINGVKGQSGSGLDWFYTNSQGAGTVPSASSPVNITDSELPIYGKSSLTY